LQWRYVSAPDAVANSDVENQWQPEDVSYCGTSEECPFGDFCMTSLFRFKQFTVQQDRCAMKVGTDGIMLGAWANADRPQRILDIGSGTGLIALMLAQRFPDARIDAVEIEKGAAKQAQGNVARSLWEHRINVQHLDTEQFQPPCRYDLVVSNPPYFADSLKGPDIARNMARHADSLSAMHLLESVDRLLNSSGTFCVILPIADGTSLLVSAAEHQLHCQSICEVRPNVGKTAHRWLISFTRSEVDVVARSSLIVEAGRHNYSDEYRTLTREFYLKH